AGNRLCAPVRRGPVADAAAGGGAGFGPSGASTATWARTVADPKAPTRSWCAVHGAPCDSGDGIAEHAWAPRAWLSDRVSPACLDQCHAIEYLSLHGGLFPHGR